jgi:HK97 family phage portal protein
MGLLDWFAHQLGYTKAERRSKTPDWMLADAASQRWSLPDPSLHSEQADLYRRLSWIQIAVSAVATIASGTPFAVRRRADEQLIEIPNHPFELLLARPNPLDSRYELLESTFSFYQIAGNAYWWLNRGGPDEEPSEIWPIPPQHLQPIPDGKQYLAGYAYYPDGMMGAGWVASPPFPLHTWEVVHFKRFNPLSRFIGLSPLEALAVSAATDLRQQQWNANFFSEQNAKLAGALLFADMVNDTDWETIKGDILNKNAGVRRSLMLLRGVGKGGVEWAQMGISQDEMQFLESRQFTREEIFNLFAPGLASVLAVNATEANAATGKASLIEFAVWPLLVAVAEKITNNLLPIYDRRSPRSLVGQFTDIRPTDRAAQLRELQLAGDFLDEAEIRQRYFGLPPRVGNARERP